MIVAALKQEEPPIKYNTVAAFYTIDDIAGMYQQRYNDDRPSYHAIYMAMVRNRIPSAVLAGRRVVQGKDIPIALEIIKSGGKARRQHKARKEMVNGR